MNIDFARSQYYQQNNKLFGIGTTSNERQGISVCVSGDGLTAVVGGDGDNNGKGAAWIYIKNISSPTAGWIQQGAKIVGNNYQGFKSSFGFSSSISFDGNIAVIGGYTDNTNIGAAWIISRYSNMTWFQQGNKLVGSGYIGSPFQAYSVGISSDGMTVVVGGYADNSNVGAIWIYMFDIVSGNWLQVGNKLVGNGAIGAACQGVAVSISSDGSTIASGGYNDGSSHTGAIWIFTRNGINSWIQQGSKTTHPSAISYAYLGTGVALSSDGNTLVTVGYGDGSSNIGGLYILTRDSDSWYPQGEANFGNEYNNCGLYSCSTGTYSVAVSRDGNVAAFGAQSDAEQVGATWMWTRSTNGIWAQYYSKLVGQGYYGNDKVYQGASVSLSGSGTTLFVGGYGDKNNNGAVWVFTTASEFIFHAVCLRPLDTSSIIFSTACSVQMVSGTSCVGVCASGYNLSSGDLVITCTNGSTPTAMGICSPKNCDELPKITVPGITLGNCNLLHVPHLTNCSLGCLTTYTQSGSMTVTCLFGKWSSPVGSCQPNCASTPLLANSVQGTCTNNFPSGKSCTLTCAAGYINDGSLESTCFSGTWGTFTSSCLPCGDNCNTFCITPPTIPNGAVAGSCTSPMSQGQSCHFACDDNHKLSGGDLMTKCLNADWTMVKGNCVKQVTLSSLGKKSSSFFSILLTIISTVIIFVGSLLYCIARHLAKTSANTDKLTNPFGFLVLAVSTADFLSDFAVLMETMSRNEQGLLDGFVFAMSTFLILPLVVNFIVVFRLVMSYTRNSIDATKWIQQNMVGASIIGFLSLFNSENILLLCSNCFGIAFLSAPLPSQEFINNVELSGVLTNIVEDLPQLIVQIIISYELHTFSPLVAVSITFSVIAVGISLFKRLLVYSVVSATSHHHRPSFLTGGFKFGKKIDDRPLISME